MPGSLAQVFSCEFCNISKNTFYHRTPPVAASEFCQLYPSASNRCLFRKGTFGTVTKFCASEIKKQKEYKMITCAGLRISS